MQIYSTGLVVILIWVFCVLRGRAHAVALVGALLPFGMLNVFRIGGFSFVADDFVAAACVGLFTLFYILNRPAIKLHNAGVLLCLLALYGLFASFFLVRHFSGTVDVFVFGKLFDGVRISRDFLGSLHPLGPVSSNISQMAYLILDICFFFVVYAVAHRAGLGILITGLRIGACINILLGLVEMIGLGGLLSGIKTADYTVLDHHTIAGVPRLTGGFAEASAYGAVSASFAGFFLLYGLFAGKNQDLIIGVISLCMATLALSSGGLIGFAVVLLFLFICGVWRLQIALPPRALYGWALIVTTTLLAVILGLGAALLDTEGIAYQVIDRLILSKSETASGLERGAMAMNGLEVFWATYGLGAGVGSVKANGHGFAVLAAMGLPGALLIIAFYILSYFGPHGPLNREKIAVRRAAQCFFLVSVTIALTSSFSSSPGLARIYVAAIALAAVAGTRKNPEPNTLIPPRFYSRRSLTRRQSTEPPS